MEVKHAWVSLLDILEVLPFAVFAGEKEIKNEKLFEFIDTLSEIFEEKIYYIGSDIIQEKFYERFLFEKGGFLEIMLQAPVAIIAHFVEKDRAEKFAEALKSALEKICHEKAEMLKNLIEVSCEEEQALNYKTWEKLKEIRGVE